LKLQKFQEIIKDQLSLLLQDLWLPVGAKMNLHGPGRPEVVRVMMGGKQGARSNGNMNCKVYVAERGDD
jgi:hypothetical protein